MTATTNRAIFKVLNWAIGLILAWFSIDALFLYLVGENRIVSRCLNLLLVLSLVILGLVGKKARRSEKVAHDRLIEEMGREVEKIAVRYKSLLEGAGFCSARRFFPPHAPS